MAASRQILHATIALATCVFIGACGADETPEPPDPRQEAERAAVTKEDVEEAAEGSPERTILDWWRLTQFRSPDAIALFTPEVASELDEAGYERLAFRYLGPWLATVRPEIEEVRTDGDEADAFVELSGPRYLTPTKATIQLERIDDEWRISDPTFMLEQALLLEEQEEATLDNQSG